jgi:hypothetical protein
MGAPSPASRMSRQRSRPLRPDVEDYQVVGKRSRLLESTFTIGGTVDRVAFPSKAIAQRHPECLLVFHQQDVLFHGPLNSARPPVALPETGKRSGLPTS